MDIYLLRDGKEHGPFSEEMTQSFLRRGVILMEDLAWTPGLPSWSPLVQILHPPAARVDEPVMVEETHELIVEEAPEPVIEKIHEPVAEAAKSVASREPATPKQMAFLSYLGIAFTSNTTKEKAAVLVNEAMEDPKMAARVLQWNDDKLRLHPEIFAEEALAKKEGRAGRYFEACQREGTEYFVGVTKAHCQVLVGFLDVTYPAWEANEATAARNYFFPAVADKFPQLVHKQWRDTLKYPEGATVAVDRKKTGPVTRPNGAPSPIAALIRGVVFGLALLLALYVGKEMFTGDPAGEAPAPEPVKPVAVKPVEPPKSVVPPVREVEKPVVAEVPPADAPATTDPAPAAGSTARTHVIIQKPVEVKLRFGTAKLAAGTKLKIVSRDGVRVTVTYGNDTVTIPIEDTDIGAALPEQ